MDNISEQLVKIEKTPKDNFLLCGIWFAAFILVFVFVLISLRISSLIGFLFLFIAGVIYGAFKLSNMLKKEYEYIVVNRDMDIDKIIAQSSRKRMVNIKLNEVQEYGMLTVEKTRKLKNKHFDAKYICCNPSDEAQYLIYKHPKKGLILVVLAMNEETKNQAEKAIPRIVKAD